MPIADYLRGWGTVSSDMGVLNGAFLSGVVRRKSRDTSTDTTETSETHVPRAAASGIATAIANAAWRGESVALIQPEPLRSWGQLGEWARRSVTFPPKIEIEIETCSFVALRLIRDDFAFLAEIEIWQQ